MAKNQFTVDLGNLRLTSDQTKNINGAIQKAVASELSRIKTSKNLVLIPVGNWKKGPIINGIIARPVDLKTINSIIK